MRLGVLDIGSNTVHLLIVDAWRGEPPRPVFTRKWRLLLAERVGRDGSLGDEALNVLQRCLAEAKDLAGRLQVEDFLPFATAVVRDAPNRDAVVGRLRATAGVELSLLSGWAEARLTFAAARRWFGWSAGPMLLIDIGGGSLEIALGRDEVPSFAASHPLGAARLSREWLPDDPPFGKACRATARHIRSQLDEVVVPVLRSQATPGLVVATSKTFEQLARIAGAPSKGHGPFVTRELTFEGLDRWLPRLARMSAEQRARLPGVSRHRSRQLLAGAIVAHTTMQALEVRRIRLCPWGVREGIVFRRLDSTRAARWAALQRNGTWSQS